MALETLSKVELQVQVESSRETVVTLETSSKVELQAESSR